MVVVLPIKWFGVLTQNQHVDSISKAEMEGVNKAIATQLEL